MARKRPQARKPVGPGGGEYLDRLYAEMASNPDWMAGYSGPKFNPDGTVREEPSVDSGPSGGDGGDGDGGGGGGGGGGGYDLYEAQRQKNAIAVIKGLLDQYNLGSLYGKIVEYVKEGYDADTVMILIRTTPEYKQRFPAMETLAKRGRAISEATYIEYERGAAALEQRYGLPKDMLMGNVTKLLEAEVSAVELNDRVQLASAASLQAPQDLKDTLSSYYGIGQGGLTAYFLDPAVAMPLLEKQYATAQIGTEAIRQDVNIGVGIASQLQDIGVTQEQARAGFGNVAGQRAFQYGRGETISQEGLINANLANNREAQKQIERISQSRTGAFEGGGQFATDQSARSGITSAAR